MQYFATEQVTQSPRGKQRSGFHTKVFKVVWVPYQSVTYIRGAKRSAPLFAQHNSPVHDLAENKALTPEMLTLALGTEALRAVWAVRDGMTPLHCLAKNEALTPELLTLALGSELLQAARTLTDGVTAAPWTCIRAAQFIAMNKALTPKLFAVALGSEALQAAWAASHQVNPMRNNTISGPAHTIILLCVMITNAVWCKSTQSI